MKFDGDRIENILDKGENYGNQHYSLFSECFHKPFPHNNTF